jgi:hypothetical protein
MTATAPEGFIIKTRWTKAGTGRADIVAVNPSDQKPGTYEVSQCWDSSYVSTYEQGEILSQMQVFTSGDAQTCAFPQATFPSQADLPDPTNGTVNH